MYCDHTVCIKFCSLIYFWHCGHFHLRCFLFRNFSEPLTPMHTQWNQFLQKSQYMLISQNSSGTSTHSFMYTLHMYSTTEEVATESVLSGAGVLLPGFPLSARVGMESVLTGAGVLLPWVTLSMVSEWYPSLTSHQHQKGHTVPKQV